MCRLGEAVHFCRSCLWVDYYMCAQTMKHSINAPGSVDGVVLICTEIIYSAFTAAGNDAGELYASTLGMMHV